MDVEHTHVKFLGNLVLNLWDCGGQYRFYESYFDSQRDTIFRNVEVLIYVFDIDSGDLENDITLFDGILEAMEQNSPDASIFVLIHKMDLVGEDERVVAFNERASLIQSRSQQFKMRCFATSIWDETLYRAWSAIVYSLIPNVALLETQVSGGLLFRVLFIIVFFLFGVIVVVFVMCLCINQTSSWPPVCPSPRTLFVLIKEKESPLPLCLL